MNIKGLIYRTKLAIANRAIYWAERLGHWGLLRKLDLMGYPQRDRVSALLKREIAAIGPSVEAYLTHQKTEIEILSARLSRRYDPGAALNEATDRAIVAKKLAMAGPGGVVEVTNAQFEAYRGTTGNEPIATAPTKGLLISERGEDAPKPGQSDFWEREAARQREARAANPEPMPPLTETQKAALEHQKRAVKRMIENA